jgi:hypothetical protein
VPSRRTAINLVLAVVVVGAPVPFFILVAEGRGLLAALVAVGFVAAVVAASRLAWPGQRPALTVSAELCDSGNERPGRPASTAAICAYLLVGACGGAGDPRRALVRDVNLTAQPRTAYAGTR